MSAEVVPLPVKEPSLAPILSLTATAMNSVNAIILDRMQSEIPLIPALAGHMIAGGGKRMRPMLTLACAELLGYPGTRHHKLAAAVEFIHTATLLHDDVVDGSGLRRGRRTANLIWGNPASVLVGDFLFAPERANSPVRTLSGGERNRLLLARRFDALPAGPLRLSDALVGTGGVVAALACGRTTLPPLAIVA